MQVRWIRIHIIFTSEVRKGLSAGRPTTLAIDDGHGSPQGSCAVYRRERRRSRGAAHRVTGAAGAHRVTGAAGATRPKLSVILPSRNGAATLPVQLEALARQTWDEPWELLVSDNGSTDETAEVVGRFHGRIPGLRIVDASARAGLPYASNMAVREARAPALAFCNDDDEVAPGWLSAMGRALARQELVAGRLEHDKLNEEWTVTVRGRPQENGLERWSLGSHLPFGFGCSLGIHRALHDAINGFDEEMFPAGEDVDYCWRAQYEGAKLQFEPDAVTHYRLRGEWSSIYRQGRNYGIGDVLLYRKHRHLGLPKIPHRGRRAARAWLGIGKQFTLASSRVHRGLALWNLGWRTGMLEASVRNRVLLL
jgi:GT2 family glycosyltransferase